MYHIPFPLLAGVLFQLLFLIVQQADKDGDYPRIPIIEELKEEEITLVRNFSN